MKKNTNNITVAAFTGVMIGAAVGLMANSIIMKQKKRITKSASRALNSMGETMQNISSHMR